MSEAAAAPVWTRPFTFAVLATASTFTGFYFLIPALPPWAARVGASESQIGLVVGVYSIAAIFVRLSTAHLLDRHGRKPFLVVGLAGFILASLGYATVNTLTVLIALRIAHGAVWAWVTTAFGALVSDLAPPLRRGEAIGYWGLAPTIAMAIGPMLGGILLDAAGFTSVFIGTAALGGVALLLAGMIREPERPVAPAAPRRVSFSRATILPSAVLFFSSLSYGAVIAFMPVELAREPGRAGLFFSLYAVAILFSRPFGGRLSDRFGRAAVIHPGLAVGAVGTLLIGLADRPLFLVASAILYGVGIGGFSFPALMALTVDRSDPAARSAAIAGFFIAYDLAISLGAILLGPVYGRFGFGVMAAVAAAAVVLAQLLFLFDRRSGRREGERDDTNRST